MIGNGIRFIVFTALLIGSAAPSFASEQARQFLSGLEAYNNEQYATAIEHFSGLAEQGITNGQLYYNLGNAYLKNNDLGSSILWYERALELTPNDPDLIFNLNYARSLTKDAPEESASPLVRIFFFWKYQLSERTIIWTAIVLNFIFWVFIAAWRFTRRKGLARAAWMAAGIASIMVLTTGFNYYEKARIRQAILLPEQTAVRSGLDETSTELFVLHAGAKVRIIKQLDNHFQIRFSNDKIGWIGKSAAGLI